jgi:uncharacterized membrane protein YbaN (DUF454 family)
MTQHVRRVAKITLGVLLLVLGVIGLLLPVIPQVPFLIGGLTLLSSENRHCAALLEYIKKRVGWQQSTPSHGNTITEADDVRR